MGARELAVVAAWNKSGAFDTNGVFDDSFFSVDGGRGFGFAGGVHVHDGLDAEGGLVVDRGFGAFQGSVRLDTGFGSGVNKGLDIDGGLSYELGRQGLRAESGRDLEDLAGMNPNAFGGLRSRRRCCLGERWGLRLCRRLRH